MMKSVGPALFLLGGCLVADADAQAQRERLPERRIVPYVEAQGQPAEQTRPLWVSPARVAFTATKDDISWREGNKKEEGVLYLRYSRVEEVRVFDVEKRATTRHIDGRLHSIEEGALTIGLERVLPDAYIRRRDPAGAYEIRMVGPLGAEQQVRYELAGDKPPAANCPGHEGARGQRWMLRAGHGCLQDSFEAPMDPWVYYKANGEKSVLPVRHPDVGPPVWIPWMAAYLLGDYVTMSRGKDGARSQSVALLYPDGRVRTIEVDEWSLTKVRPTRAGLTAVRLLPRLPEHYDGIYLWRSGGSLQIAEGTITAEVAVSPDGCRLAYAADRRRQVSSTPSPRALRVVDVCAAFDLTQQANPFE